MADYTGAAKGALGGASTGFTIGGPWGAAVGGILGGAAGLFGKKKKKKRVSTLDDRQQRVNADQQSALYGEGPLADLYNYDPEAANEVFDRNIADPSIRKFNESIVPGVTGQFRSQGLQNSSYAGDAISRMARDVQENLNAQRSQYLYGEQQNARNAKRSAVENYQNRQNFSYDTSSQNSGFDIDNVLKSISPEMIEQARNYFSKNKGS